MSPTCLVILSLLLEATTARILPFANPDSTDPSGKMAPDSFVRAKPILSAAFRLLAIGRPNQPATCLVCCSVRLGSESDVL